MKHIAIIAALVAASSVAACASAPAPVRQVESIPALKGPAPEQSVRPLQAGITCLRQELDQAAQPIRFAVSSIPDETGKVSYEASQGGTAVSQGATIMAMSSLSALGPNVRQVIRRDTRVAEWELSAATNGYLKNGATQLAPRGEFEGSEYFIAGAITEVNWNWDSKGWQLEVGGGGVKWRSFTMDVAVDMYLGRSNDLTMVGETFTARKQIEGRVSEIGLFSFLGGDDLVDARTGYSRQEPIQYALRSAVELGILELTPRAFGTSFDRCREYARANFAY